MGCMKIVMEYMGGTEKLCEPICMCAGGLYQCRYNIRGILGWEGERYVEQYMMYRGRYELYGWTGQGMRAYMYMCEGVV